MATPPDFSVGQVLTAAHMNAVGLWKVGGGTMNATNNDYVGVFTNDFDDYLIHLSGVKSTANGTINIRLLSGTTPAAGAGTYQWSGLGLSVANAALNYYNNSSDFYSSGAQTESTAVNANLSVRVFGPKIAAPTHFLAETFTYSTAFGYFWRGGGGRHNNATSYDGIRIYLGAAGNLQGTCTIYGYRKP